MRVLLSFVGYARCSRCRVLLSSAREMSPMSQKFAENHRGVRRYYARTVSFIHAYR